MTKRHAELRFDERGHCREHTREPPAPRSGGEDRREEWQRADRVNLSPVRSGEDDPRVERPDRGGRYGGRAPGGAPHDSGSQKRDGDVCRNAHRLDRETEELAVEERAKEPEHVEEGRRVVAEIARLVEATRADLREPLGPRLERADVRGKALRSHGEKPDDHSERDHADDEEHRATLGATAIVAHCQ